MKYNKSDTLFELTTSSPSKFVAFSAEERNLPPALFGVEFRAETNTTMNYVVKISSGYSNSRITTKSIEDAVDNWMMYLEDYKPKIYMCDDAPADIRESACVITIKNMGPNDDGLGLTEFNDANGNRILNTYDGSIVTSITIKFAHDTTLTQTEINNVVMHELGHAMGLAHPHHCGYADYTINNQEIWTVLALLNQKLFNTAPLSSAMPSGFDLWNLGKKWGN